MKRNSKLNKKYRCLTLTVLILCGLPLHAEMMPILSSGTVMPAMPTGGRDEKAGGASNTGSSGSNAATGAGIAFMSTAAAMFAMLAIPEGIMYATMGAMEFAQAAQDSNSSGANTGQQQLLTQDNALGAQQPGGYNSQAVANQLASNPALTNALQSMGVDPSDFLGQVASGQMTTPEQIVAALGMTDNFTPEEVAAMSPSNAANANSFGGAPLATEESGTLAAARTATIANKSSSDLYKNADEASVSKATSSSNKEGGTTGGGGVAAENGFSGLVPSLLAQGGTIKGQIDSLTDMQRLALKNKGILKPLGKYTIFHVAGRNYNSFKVWRKTRYRNPHRQTPRIEQTDTKLALSIP